jgi:glycosyltransferase involved in cell wall biosynthesis
MKLALDLRRIGNPGIGRYMKCLVEAVVRRDAGHEYVLILPPGASEKVEVSGNVTSVISSAPYYSLREQIELPRILRRHNVHLLHSPHFVLPLAQVCPSVVTIHDVIYLACQEDLPSRAGRLYYAAMLRASTRLARQIITVSKFSKDEIVQYLNVDPHKIRVIYPAVDVRFCGMPDQQYLEAVLDRYKIDGDYVFYTGIYRPRKNHHGLFRAFRHFVASGGSAKLVIAGPIGDGERQLQDLARSLDIAGRVIFTGHVADSELRALYSGARVYACPSLYEGFGFTVLEAMACGVPVVCSTAASLPEVGGDAVLYADARDPEKFAEALYRAFTDQAQREDLVARGYQNVSRFGWEHAADSCLEIYKAVVGKPMDRALAFT